MMPPPAMTTSALSTDLGDLRLPRHLHHSPHLKDQLEGGKRGDVLVVDRRRDLDDVESNELRAPRCRLEQCQRLPRRETARGRDLRPRRECGGGHIDVE